MKNINLGLGSLVVVFVVFAIMARANAQTFVDHRVDGSNSWQAERISNGVANGTMSSTQATNLQAYDSKITAKAASDAAANGGSLTAAESRHLNHAANRVSRSIRRDKRHSEASDKTVN